MAPLVGPLVDRYGGRWLMAGGALAAGTGLLLLGQVTLILAISSAALAISRDWRRVHVPYGGQRHDLALVCAPARPRDSDCQPGARFFEGAYPGGDRDSFCMARLARHLGGFWFGDFSPGGRAGAYLHAAQPGRAWA